MLPPPNWFIFTSHVNSFLVQIKYFCINFRCYIKWRTNFLFWTWNKPTLWAKPLDIPLVLEMKTTWPKMFKWRVGWEKLSIKLYKIFMHFLKSVVSIIEKDAALYAHFFTANQVENCWFHSEIYSQVMCYYGNGRHLKKWYQKYTHHCNKGFCWELHVYIRFIWAFVWQHHIIRDT